MRVFGLRKTTLQPRLFQQACRYASSSRRSNVSKARAQNAHHLKVAPGKVKKSEDENDGIRWFEQDVDSGVTRRVAGNPEELEAEELKQKIHALETELQEYREDTSDTALLATLEPAERKKVEKALRQRAQRENEITSGLEVSLELPPLSVPLLKRLNAALRDAALNPQLISRRKDLWRWYSRAKHNIPALPRMMPDKAWQLLWDSQSEDLPSNPDRLVHMEQLLLDMASIDRQLVPDQDVVYIDTLASLGKLDPAINRWRELYNDADAGASHPLLAQGVKLFSQVGDLDKAQSLLQELLQRFPNKDPRVVLPLLVANANTGNDHMAFGLYLMLRTKLGSAMTMNDYDTVALTFLDLDKKDLALAVFRDMMLRGKKPIEDEPDYDFGERSHIYNKLYDAVFERLGLLTDKVTSPFELNNVSLSAMGALPVQWQNKFFYGSWLKKLIGMNQLDAALKVVELMYERGAQPDPKHFNGIIGALMRTGVPELQDRGEQLAWHMIQQRLDYKWRTRSRRRGDPVPPMPSIYQTEEGLEVPIHVTRPVPRATTETFNILALHYLVHEKWAYILHLHRMLRPADLPMGTFFMNHFLYMELNTKDQKAAWRSFLKLAKNTGPDMETYNCLWTGQLHNLDSRRTQDRSGFPPPRQLFSLMVTSFSKGKPREFIGDFDMVLYAKIINSFCMDKDLAGCLAALHGILEKFGKYPDADIARAIVTAVSNTAEFEPPTIRGRRGRQQLPTSEIRLKNTSNVLATLAKRRALAAREHGVDITTLQPEARQKESLNLLSEFLRVVLVRINKGPDAVESAIEEACNDMRLSGITTGDIDATNVS